MEGRPSPLRPLLHLPLFSALFTHSSNCGGDDWGCYHVAQQNLLALLEEAPGCNIVLTGDFHFGDIKKLEHGSHKPYAEFFDSANNTKPLYQIMSSGLTESTARDVACSGFRKDPMHLRTHAECDFVRGPNFGLLDVRFVGGEVGEVRLQVRDGKGRVKLESRVMGRECRGRKD